MQNKLSSTGKRNALALRALGRANGAAARKAEAENGFRALGAASLLERLEREWEG